MRRWLVFAVLAFSVIVVMGQLPSSAAPLQPGPTAPAPTWTPGSPAPKPPLGPAKASRPAGGRIVLQVQFPDTWSSMGIAWQQLWTVVQWQDEKGAWHDVDGWQGGLDAVTEDVGEKSWWLPGSLFGKGPFRWLVLASRGGQLLAVSEPFDLPDERNGLRTVTVVIVD